MSVELAVIISIISVSASIIFGLSNYKRNNASDIGQKAAETATINVKLDTIGSDVRDIKYDITAVKKDVQALSERMIVVEQSTKSAHKRVDEILEKEGA